jgi:hypothetical protein
MSIHLNVNLKLGILSDDNGDIVKTTTSIYPRRKRRQSENPLDCLAIVDCLGPVVKWLH